MNRPHPRSAAATFVVALALSLCACRAPAPAPPASYRAPHPPVDLHIADYTIDATLAGDHRVIDAVETVRFTNTTRAPATELWWHLYMNAFANDRTLFMRTGGRYGHRGSTPGAHGRIEVSALTLATGEKLLDHAHYDVDVPDDATQLATPLPYPLAPGESVEVRVTFRTVLPAAFARTGYWRDFTFAAQWFPKLAVLEPDGRWARFPFHYVTEFYADFGRYDVTLTVPAGDVVGASGLEVSAPEPGPRGERHHFVAADVHDFAWTSWREFETWTPSAGGLALRVLYPPGMRTVAERNVRALDTAVPLFSQAFGPYPYEQLTVVLPPPGADGVEGMEYPTLITTGGAWFSPPGVHDAEYVAAHEFAHQYFYGLLASNENAWPFLDEGFAEYATGLAMEAMFPPDGALVQAFGLSVGFWDYQGGFAALGGHGSIARAAPTFGSYESYGALVYRRTAALIETVRRVRGREATARWLRRYADANRFRHPGPEALLSAAESEFGRDFSEGFLRPALFGDAELNYRVAGVEPDRAALRREGALALDVEADGVRADGTVAQVSFGGAGNTGSIERGAGAPLVAARLDYAQRVVIERTRLDNAVAPGRKGSLAALAARAAYWLAAALGALGP